MKDKFLIFLMPLWVFLGLIAVGVFIWAFISGWISAENYSLEPFFYSISEWNRFWRVMLYFYSIFVVGMTGGMCIETFHAIRRE